MDGWTFIVTQSIKKLFNTLKTDIFNDTDFRLLSSDRSITIADLQAFDKTNPVNKGLYNDNAYKIINASKAMDLVFTETT